MTVNPASPARLPGPPPRPACRRSRGGRTRAGAGQPPASQGDVVRIAYVIDCLGWGGAQRQLVELVRALPKDRYVVEVISLSDDKVAYVEVLRQAGIALTLIPHSGKWSWTTLVRLYQALRRFRPAIVHTGLFTADLYGRVAARLAGVPWVVSTTQSVDSDKPWHYVLVDRWLKTLTDHFIVNAEAVGEVLCARERVARRKITTIYNGIDLERFRGQEQDGALRRQYGISAAQPLIGIVGRLAPVKDHETFIRAAWHVCQQLPTCAFVIVGSGPLKSSLEQLVAHLGMGANVHFVDTQTEVERVYTALDLLVVTSRYEGCCNVILEAMATGKPIVATAVGGNPELVIPGQTGLLVPPRQPKRIAEAILTLLHDPEQARRLGRGGRHHVETQFALDRMVDQTEAVYRRLVERAAP